MHTIKNSSKVDAWIVRLDKNVDVDEEWTFGGSSDDAALSIVEVGNTVWFGGRTESSGKGKMDAWLVAIDDKGFIKTETTYGERYDDYNYKLTQIGGGGLLVLGGYSVRGKKHMNPWAFTVDKNAKLLDELIIE